MTRLYAAVAVTAVLALLAATAAYILWSPGSDRFAGCRRGAVAGGGGAIGGPFELVDQFGEVRSDSSVFTEPALLYFGYTFCPDVCPLDVARNAEAIDILAEMGHSVLPVFITVDPERDTPEVLEAFAANMHPRMIALGGSEEQVRRALQAYRAVARRHEDGGEFYLVDHSTFTYLVLPETGFAEFFRRDLGPEDVARQTACFLDAR